MTMRAETVASIDQEAAAIWVDRSQGAWTFEQEASLDARLRDDPTFAEAYARAEGAWAALDIHGQSPEIMRHRETALAEARRASARRWLLPSHTTRSAWRKFVVAAALVAALGVAWQLSPFGYVPGQYTTSIGEQKTIELADQSRVVLDAGTRLRVRYSSDVRAIELQRGQAQFTATNDPARPFKVFAGGRTIVAVGTVFTVDYADTEVRVATLEGRVAVIDADANTNRVARQESEQTMARSQSEPAAIELPAGQELRVSDGGKATVIPEADLEAATAWRQGKIILRAEALGDAVRRVNRYSRVQIELADSALAARKISGVFEAGDTAGFVDAVERYLPATAESVESNKILLRSR